MEMVYVLTKKDGEVATAIAECKTTAQQVREFADGMIARRDYNIFAGRLYLGADLDARIAQLSASYDVSYDSRWRM